jgi:branched-chain amino acid transport system substrate-binding protein
MMSPIKIGFLTPYSGIYPSYSDHLMAGILLGLYPSAINQTEFQFVPVYSRFGDIKGTADAVEKLIFFDRVDIVSGLISYRAVPAILPEIERHHKLGFFFDMGEYIPYFEQLSQRIFYSSQQIWQSQYALGYWAQKEFGGICHMVMPIYEAGYHLSSAFHKGAEAAGATQTVLNVLPYDPENGQSLVLDKFFDELIKNPPTFVHAVFAGNMANQFLAAWRDSRFYHTIPLTVVENMVYEDVLSAVVHLDMELYAAASWSRSSENARNVEFVKRYETSGGQLANIYGLLGYEAGLALKEVKPYLLKRDWDSVATLLQKESVNGPRGERNFYPLSGFSLPVIDILKIRTSAKKIFKTVISRGTGLKFDSPEFKSIHDGCVSGWQNPYLCI